ncbi:hypothetical protein HY358_00555 [Candidatus Roizmanbacteria bacterium]|nr:hypothetical protein [Candidatus Roizmanbacteria bacterium]
MELVLLLVQMILLFFLTRRSINELFFLFTYLTHDKKSASTIIAMLFFPGTAIHEMAHFLMATALLQRVHSIHIFPELHGHALKLGKVLYEKKDFLRGILVGVAPLLAGLFFLWFVATTISSIETTVIRYGLFFYLTFVISSTMFSSKQDLIDLVYIVPVLLLISAIVYVFNIPIQHYAILLLSMLEPSLQIVNRFVFYSLVVHCILIGGIFLLKPILPR